MITFYLINSGLNDNDDNRVYGGRCVSVRRAADLGCCIVPSGVHLCCGTASLRVNSRGRLSVLFCCFFLSYLEMRGRRGPFSYVNRVFQIS